VRVLVTGAAGFIGGHLANALVKKGYEVRCLVRKTSNVDYLKKLGVELFYGDIRGPDSLEKALSNVDVVYHLAGILGRWGVSDKAYWDVHVKGTQNLLDACVRQNVKRFIHCSSAGVVGPVSNPPADESYPYSPSNIYEKTKAEAEKLVLQYHSDKGLPVTVLRPEFVYGPGDMHVLPLFRAIRKRRFPIIGKGESLLHPTYVGDVIQAFLLCLDNDKAIGEIYFIAGEAPITVKELVAIIAEELNVPTPRVCIPQWLSYAGAGFMEMITRLLRLKEPLLTCSQVKFFTQHRAFDTSKAKRDVGYQPVQLRQGLRQTIHWYQQNGYLQA